MEFLHEVLHTVAEYAIVFLELVGVAIIIVSGVQGVINYVRRDPMTRIKLGKGIETALEFKLGGEILRTVVVREFSEILMVGGIILLRAAITFLLHWEVKSEEDEAEHERELEEHLKHVEETEEE